MSNRPAKSPAIKTGVPKSQAVVVAAASGQR